MTKAAVHYKLLAGEATIDNVEVFLREINSVALSNNATIQAIDASKIADKQHIETAVRQSLRSFEDRRSIATNLGVEILLRLSACRQIKKALNLGVKKGDMDILFVIVGTQTAIEGSIHKLNKLMVVDPHVIAFRESKREVLMQTFNITEEEVEAAGGTDRIPELVRERLALFDAFER